MANWKITIKVSDNVNVGGVGTIHLEKGMYVEYSSKDSFFGPLDSNDSRDAVNQLFKSKYGIDLKKYGQLTSVVLDCKKI